MSAIQRVRCPNCGDFAERQVLNDRQAPGCDRIVQTACEACDYLMIMGFPAGKVLEAYAPGQVSPMQHSSEVDVSPWMRTQRSISPGMMEHKTVQLSYLLFSRTS